MIEDGAWYGSRHRRRPHCIRRVPSAARNGQSTPPLLGPCLLWPRSPISATAELLLYKMKLCSRRFVLYCRSRPKNDKYRKFGPHFEEVRGGVEPWCMARWKARAEFLFSVIGLLFLSLTVEALQGKMCQDSLPSGGGRSLGAKISGGRARRGCPWGIFFLVYTKLDTFCYPAVQTAPCYVPSF